MKISEQRRLILKLTTLWPIGGLMALPAYGRSVIEERDHAESSDETSHFLSDEEIARMLDNPYEILPSDLLLAATADTHISNLA